MAMLRFTSAGPAPQQPEVDKHRQLIGHIGMWLPFILIGIVWWRDGFDAWLNLDSVSAYYYSGAVAAFAGMLVVLALFLFTYDGYRNEYHRADRICAVIAGIAALGVAFFPTSAPVGITSLPWVKPWVVWVHFGSAVVLFVMFAVFCLWLFTKTAKGLKPDRDKKQRNAFYVLSGTVIVVCIAWAFFNRLRAESIFWPESVALVAFASSWLVKGYAHTQAIEAVRSWLAPKSEDVDDSAPNRG